MTTNTKELRSELSNLFREYKGHFSGCQMALKIYGYEMSLEDFTLELLEKRIQFDINSMHREDEFLKLISQYEASLYPEETEAHVPTRLEIADEEANKIIASINQIKFPKRS